MANYRIDKQEYRRDDDTIFEVQMLADQYGNIINGGEGASSRSAFGEPLSIPITPVLQLDGLYGLDPQSFETYQSGGTVGTTETMMQCSTGTGEFGYGVLRSKRSVRYRPGQGALARFTAKFSPGVEGYTQRAGFFAQEQAVQIGYDGTEFGVLRQNGGKAHIEIITITAAATASSNITITYPTFGGATASEIIAITVADTPAAVARKIATAFSANPFFIVESYDSKVCFLSTAVGPRIGAFSYDAGTTGTAATLATVQPGVDHVLNWTKQVEFNVDRLDGSGPSGITINPQMLNVFQINFRWLGAGEIRYAMENPENGDMIFFHHEHYSNRNTDVHIDNPSLKIGYVAASLGGSGTNVVVEGASMMGAIEGIISPTKLPTATFRESVSNLTSNTWHHALTVKNNLVFRGKINTRELLLRNINTAVSGTGPVSVALILNATGLSGERIYSSINEFSSVSSSNTPLTVTLGDQRIMYIFDMEAGGSRSLDLENLRIAIPPNNTVSVLLRSSQQISRNSVSLSWVED